MLSDPACLGNLPPNAEQMLFDPEYWRRRGELDLLRLSHALEAESALDPRTVAPSDLMAANRRFHDALAAAAHNQTLVDLQDRLSLHAARLAETTLSAPGR